MFVYLDLKVIIAPHRKPILVKIDSGNTISQLKEIICQKKNIPANLQIIEIYNKDTNMYEILENEDNVDKFQNESLIIKESKLLPIIDYKKLMFCGCDYAIHP